MAQKSIDQLQRLINLVPFLKANQGISIADLASRFRVSEKEIEKDLSILFLCGLPGYTHLELIDIAFDDGYVFVKDSQNLDKPNHFTQNELARAILALKLLEHMEDSGSQTKEIISSILSKLKVEDLNLTVNNETPKLAPELLRFISLLQEGIQQDQIFKGTYFSPISDRISEREFQPVKLYRQDLNFYLEALEAGDLEVKTFRVDRFSQLTPIDHFSKEVPNQASALIDAQVKLTGSALTLVIENPLLEFELISKDKDFVIYAFKQVRENWLIREAFRHAGEIEILEPQITRSRLNQLAKRAL